VPERLVQSSPVEQVMVRAVLTLHPLPETAFDATQRLFLPPRLEELHDECDQRVDEDADGTAGPRPAREPLDHRNRIARVLERAEGEHHVYLAFAEHDLLDRLLEHPKPWEPARARGGRHRRSLLDPDHVVPERDETARPPADAAAGIEDEPTPLGE